MSIEDKAHGTVIKLLQLTVKGELKWTPTTDTHILTHGTDDVVPIAYTAELAGNRFALFEARSKASDADENIYWNDRVVLRLTDYDGTPLWDFPSMSPLVTLLRKVQVLASGVEDRLNKILEL